MNNLQNDNTLTFFREDDYIEYEDSMSSWIHPEIVFNDEVEDEDDLLGKGTAYIEDEDLNNSDIPLKPKPVEIGFLIKEYENWEGRIIASESDFIRARLFNTQKVYSPRMIQISKSVFVSKGIKKQLVVGDMFELSFKRVKAEFKNNKNERTQKENSVESIRMIEPVSLTRSEIEIAVEKELESLSYLFK